MDRLNPLHVRARVDLSSSVGESGELGARSSAPRFLRPAARLYLGVLGFVCCSAAVIAAASFVALSIQ